MLSDLSSESKTNKRIALCFSGHIREFMYDSLLTNIITPLKSIGFNIDTFASFWDVLGHIDIKFSDPTQCFKFFNEKMSPKVFHICNSDDDKEYKYSRQYFWDNYNTEQWMMRPKLSCETTCSDASMMWYIINDTFEQLEIYQKQHNIKYDVVIRLRTDLIYDTPIDLGDINDIIMDNGDGVVIMPKWRGKYWDTCHGIVDYFAFGDYTGMKKYMTTFTNIKDYICDMNIIHTAEGFLLKQLESIDIDRTDMMFSVIRVIKHNENEKEAYVENLMI